MDCKSLISTNITRSLREIYIFEDFNTLLHPELPAKRANSSLGKALSKSTRLLENLSAAFLVDAEHFFADFWPIKQYDQNTVPWENLLHPKILFWKINNMLTAAARAAHFMPKLEVMEIWNGGQGHASLFRYTYNDGKPQIL